MKKLISSALAVVLMLTVLAGCGEKERSTEKLAMYTENFSVTKPMLTYCFNAQYLSFIKTNEQYLDDYGLDTTQPLAEQECMLNNANWYDYFMDIAKNRLEQCLIVSEKALADGKKLSSDDKKAIEEEIKILKADAKEEKLNLDDYLEANFGIGVDEDVVVAVSEMEKLVTKYYGAFEEDLDTSEEAVEKYFEGHKRLYSTVDYLCFHVTPLGDTMMASTAARRTAMELSEAEDGEEFLEIVKDYLTDYYKNHYETKLSKKELKAKIEEVQSQCQVTGAGYDATSAASRWAFDDERQVNEGTYLENTEDDGYSVYYLTSLPGKEEYNSVSVRQIVYDISDYADEDEAFEAAQKAILNLELNDYSEAYFKKLAEEQSADNISKSSGGLYKNLAKGNLVEATELEEWIFDEKRKEGDITLLQTEKYGYHVVYIEEIGEPVWFLRSREGMVSSRFQEYVSDLGDDYVVYINDNIVYSISEAEME